MQVNARVYQNSDILGRDCCGDAWASAGGSRLVV
jgi:hypothetical protein